MKPARFEYHRVQTLPEGTRLLRDFGDDAKVLAGGQSLMPLLNMRLVRPSHLVDINPVGELDFVDDGGDEIRIGALTRHTTLVESALLRGACPILPAAAALVGHVAIRNRGTLGGTLSHGDPSAELPLATLAAGATFVLAGADGRREVPADEFFVGPLTTALGPTEILAEVRTPALRAGSGWSVVEVARRAGDFAVAALAVVLETDAGRVARLRVAVGGMRYLALAPAEVTRPLVAAEPSRGVIEDTARALAESVDAQSDLHGSDVYRRTLVRNLFPRAFSEALARAKADAPDA